MNGTNPMNGTIANRSKDSYVWAVVEEEIGGNKKTVQYKLKNGYCSPLDVDVLAIYSDEEEINYCALSKEGQIWWYLNHSNAVLTTDLAGQLVLSSSELSITHAKVQPQELDTGEKDDWAIPIEEFENFNPDGTLVLPKEPFEDTLLLKYINKNVYFDKVEDGRLLEGIVQKEDTSNLLLPELHYQLDRLYALLDQVKSKDSGLRDYFPIIQVMKGMKGLPKSMQPDNVQRTQGLLIGIYYKKGPKNRREIKENELKKLMEGLKSEGIDGFIEVSTDDIPISVEQGFGYKAYYYLLSVVQDSGLTRLNQPIRACMQTDEPLASGNDSEPCRGSIKRTLRTQTRSSELSNAADSPGATVDYGYVHYPDYNDLQETMNGRGWNRFLKRFFSSRSGHPTIIFPINILNEEKGTLLPATYRNDLTLGQALLWTAWGQGLTPRPFYMNDHDRKYNSVTIRMIPIPNANRSFSTVRPTTVRTLNLALKTVANEKKDNKFEHEGPNGEGWPNTEIVETLKTRYKLPRGEGGIKIEVDRAIDNVSTYLKVPYDACLTEVLDSWAYQLDAVWDWGGDLTVRLNLPETG